MDLVLRINQYFDGKKTDDEILFRAEISRKQLREVLHHYDEYVCILFSPLPRDTNLKNSLFSVEKLQTFLHPS